MPKKVKETSRNLANGEEKLREEFGGKFREKLRKENFRNF